MIRKPSKFQFAVSHKPLAERLTRQKEKMGPRLMRRGRRSLSNDLEKSCSASIGPCFNSSTEVAHGLMSCYLLYSSELLSIIMSEELIFNMLVNLFETLAMEQ
jgi:hypothetical protein